MTKKPVSREGIPTNEETIVKHDAEGCRARVRARYGLGMGSPSYWTCLVTHVCAQCLEILSGRGLWAGH